MVGAELEVEAEVLTISLPSSVDAEALWVDPVDETLWVVSKEDFGATVYGPMDASFADGDTASPAAAAELTLSAACLDFTPRITGGAVRPDGGAVVLRTAAYALVWERPSGTSLADAVDGTACAVELDLDLGGEAVALTDDGLWTVAEGASAEVTWYAAR